MWQRTLIIAEAGVNHNGSIKIARELIDAAADAGVDCVKFQTFKAGNLVAKDAQKADYQKNMTGGAESQYEMLKKLELSFEQHYELIEYCKQKQVKFFSTAFDLDSIEFLAKLNLGLWKVPSGEITNYPYLKHIASYKEPVLLSTGMCNMQDIEMAIDVLVAQGGVPQDMITVLHCNTEYPTPMKDVNLRAMQSIARRFHVEVGYSDHTKGIEVPIAAVALGAKVIEKHFTLNREMTGPDHRASIVPCELKAMVQAIRNIEEALGRDEKSVTSSEQKNIIAARKSIVALCHIKKGEIFTEQNLTIKRPGNGISPMKWESVIGVKAKRDFQTDEVIEL